MTQQEFLNIQKVIENAPEPKPYKGEGFPEEVLEILWKSKRIKFLNPFIDHEGRKTYFPEVHEFIKNRVLRK